MIEGEAAFPEASKKDKLLSMWSYRNVGLWSNGGLSQLVYLRVDHFFGV